MGRMHVALVGAELEENLAVRYLRGALEHEGHEVTQLAFDAAADLEGVAQAVVASGASVLGLSMVFTARAREFAALATRVRALGFRGHVIAGGHFAALEADALLAAVPAIDSIACGEGEEILCLLVRNLRLHGASADLEQVPGLVYRTTLGPRRSPPARNPPDLDTLPMPVHRLPPDSYLGLGIANLLGSRGCAHSCAFCSIAAWHRFCGGERHRLRAPERIADEMAFLHRQGVRIFNFHDDNFVLRDRQAMRERVVALRAALTARGVGKIAFAIKARPDEIDEELVLLLRDAGLFRMFLGIEAGTAESLRKLGRGQTASENDRALRLVNDAGIHACFNLLLLNPESTFEDFAENVAFLRRNPGNPMNFCRTEIYAGTPLERRLAAKGRLLGDFFRRDYVIEDPRAQTAFEIFRVAFKGRNYGDAALHHRTMQVDYEHQLLSCFFGTTRALRRSVKTFVVDVNGNTCDHLESVVAAACRPMSSTDRDDFARTLRVRIDADDARLAAVADEILDAIRTHAAERSEGADTKPRAHRPTTSTRAALAGLAAAAVMAAACKHPPEGLGRHASETVAASPDGPDAPKEADVDAPSGDVGNAGEARDVGDASAEADANGPPDAATADARDATTKDAKTKDAASKPAPAPAPDKPPTHYNEMAAPNDW